MNLVQDPHEQINVCRGDRELFQLPTGLEGARCRATFELGQVAKATRQS
jgi:hypothetical protein